MYGSTAQEKEPDDVTETFSNPLAIEDEASTRGAGAKELNGSENKLDMVRTVRAGHTYLLYI